MLLVEKCCEFGDDLTRRFFHEPVARATNDDAFHVLRDQFSLLDQEFTRCFLTCQDEHRHGQPRSCEAGKVFGVLFERPEVFKAGAHPARSGVSFCIDPAVTLGYGMLGVSGEVVPEMLKVNAFATLDEREGRLPVKVKMPEVTHQPNVTPVPDAGQKGVHQCDPLDLSGILRGIRVRDHQPDIVSDDPKMVVAKFSHERMNVLREFCLGVPSGWRGGLASAAQVRCDHGVGGRELGNERVPHVARFSVAMQEDDWAAGACGQLVQSRAVDTGETALHGWRRWS